MKTSRLVLHEPSPKIYAPLQMPLLEMDKGKITRMDYHVVDPMILGDSIGLLQTPVRQL